MSGAKPLTPEQVARRFESYDMSVFANLIEEWGGAITASLHPSKNSRRKK